jgi:hypothetical protein
VFSAPFLLLCSGTTIETRFGKVVNAPLTIHSLFNDAMSSTELDPNILSRVK